VIKKKIKLAKKEALGGISEMLNPGAYVETDGAGMPLV
jgi:hypothetical protein